MSRIEKAIEKATKMKADRKAEEQKLKEQNTIDKMAVSDSPFRANKPVQLESLYMVSAREPSSPISEEYKKLKSLILKSTQSDKFLNTIMVSSSIKGEGKTITALNLAITLADEYDHTVLLVDADLRQPSIHKDLGIENQIGLSDCLMNGVSVGSAMVKTGIGKLIVLTSGSELANPVEVLSSKRMKDLLKEFKDRYADRYVILDTPPLLPFAESHAVASLVDGILLVVRDGDTSVNNLKETLNLIKDRNILGIVYNDVQIDRFDGYHYYHYYKSYYANRNKDLNGPDNKNGFIRSLERKEP